MYNTDDWKRLLPYPASSGKLAVPPCTLCTNVPISPLLRMISRLSYLHLKKCLYPKNRKIDCVRFKPHMGKAFKNSKAKEKLMAFLD